MYSVNTLLFLSKTVITMLNVYICTITKSFFLKGSFQSFFLTISRHVSQHADAKWKIQIDIKLIRYTLVNICLQVILGMVIS